MNIYQTLEQIRAKGIKNIILDTDAYNEIDDQYAIAYAMRSSDSIRLLAICAAPFFNDRSSSAGDGMIKSYEEIKRITRLTDAECDIPIYKGSDTTLTSCAVPVESEAADAIVRIVNNSDEHVYIVAIGAITNVASAIIKCPEIVNKSTVIWLGGNGFMSPVVNEFNLKGDVIAAQVVFESGIALVQIPCDGVCSELISTLPEIRYYLENKNKLCDYLIDATEQYSRGRYAWSKVIWDVAAIAVFTQPEAFDTVVIPRPRITADMSYAHDLSGAPYAYIRRIRRDRIFADLFGRLGER